MISEISSKLDNPVWYALNETHLPYSLGNDQLKYYQDGFSPFVGVKNDPDPSEFGEAEHFQVFYMVGDLPDLPSHMQVEIDLKCLQMICEKPVETEYTHEIRLLDEGHAGQLSDLVNLVQPGLFSPKTRLMGDYYGIFDEDILVAVAGERLKGNEFTEVSSVINHPDHLGKGYAKQLVNHVTHKIYAENRLPILHVLDNNERAIKLYTKLGYITRRKISFWKICNLIA